MRCHTTRSKLLVAALAFGMCGWPGIGRAEMVDFEDATSAEGVSLTPGSESYWNGSDRYYPAQVDEDGTFASGSATFGNHFHYDATYDMEYWDGWAFSNRTYTEVIPFPEPNENQYFGGEFHAVAGSGADGSSTYGMCYEGWASRTPTIDVPAGKNVVSAVFTNNNYAYHTMLLGDPFGYSDPFGGTSGDEEDWFLLTITGKDSGDQTIGTVDFYLADYTFSDNLQDYIINDWTPVDLSSLAGARSLEFNLTSSDTGPYGMNTPGYFAMDNLVLQDTGGVPEPSSIVLVFTGVLGLLWWRRRPGR